MPRRQVPAIALATMLVVAVVGVQRGLGAGDSPSWSSSLKTGDVVARGTVWRVTVTPTPGKVDFWASGRVIASDTSAPFEVPLDLAPGDYKLGFCHTTNGLQKCETTETGDGTGIVARVKLVDPAPSAPSSSPGSTTPSAPSATTTTPSTQPASPKPAPGGSWSSSLKTGDVVARGTVWRVTVTPTPGKVDFWASGRVIASDTSAPFEVPLDLAPGDYKLGFCHTTNGLQKCETTETGDGTGIVARVKLVDPAPSPSPSPSSSPAPAPSTSGGTTSTPTNSPTTQTSTASTGSTRDRSAPKAVRRIDVTGAEPTGVQIRWPETRDNVAVTGYGLYLNSQTAGTTSNTWYGFSSLVCGTGYTVGVDAFDASGNRSPRTSTTVSTSACPDQVPPSAPTGIHLAAATDSTVVLTWQPSSDNVGVVGYALYVAGLQVGSTAEAAATISNLACGRSYEIGIDAVDAAGNHSNRTSAYFSTTKCADTQAPSKPAGVATTATDTSVTMSWSPSTDNVGVAGYGVYRDSSRIATTTQTTATFNGLSCGTTYALGVDAYDAAGNRSAVGSISTSTQPCAPPSSGAGWTSSLKTGDVVERGTVWRVTVTPTPGKVDFWASGRVIASDTSAPFEVPLDLAPGDYKLGFCHTTNGLQKCETTETGDGTGIVARVTIVDSSAPPPADSTPPSVPGSLRVSSANATSVSVGWSPSTDDTGVEGYGKYRGSSLVGSTTQTNTSFTGLACGNAYQVGVDAYDVAGNRSTEAAMTVTTTACADTQAPTAPTNLVVGTRTATSIALSWSPSTDNVGVVSYGLYRGGVSVGTTSGTTGIVTGLTCGTNYTLGVDAADAAGNYSPQTVVMVATTACADTQPPTAPTALVVSGVTQTALTVGWTASTDNVGVAGYTVDRNGTVVAQPTSTSANLSGLACGTTYTVGVLARDTAGNVSARTAAQATTSACSTTPPPSGAQVFVSPSGNDAAACSQVAPCRSFDRAYRVAQPGQTVEVACGSYGAQSVGRDASKTSSSDVVFRPANSAAPCVRILVRSAWAIRSPRVRTTSVLWGLRRLGGC